VAEAVWEVASLLAHEHKQYQQALELIEPWLDLSDYVAGNGRELNYTMKGLALFCDIRTGKFDQAKKLLDEEVERFDGDSRINASNPGYAEAQLYQFRTSAAEKYLQIDAPLEALALARSLKTDQKLREAAQRWNGSMQYYDQRLDRLVQSAGEKLDEATISEVVKQLVAGPDRESLEAIRKYPAFLLAPERGESKDHKPQTTCLLMRVLRSQGKKSADKEWAEKLLAEATAADAPDDAPQSLLGTVALVCLADWLDQPEPMVAQAETLIKRAGAKATETEPAKAEAKPDALAEARAALAQQERTSLWLAVDCLKRHGQKDLAVRLAEAAGSDEESAAGGKSTEQIATRLELARLRVELGETEVAEKQLRAILEDLFPEKSNEKSKAEPATK